MANGNGARHLCVKSGVAFACLAFLAVTQYAGMFSFSSYIRGHMQELNENRMQRNERMFERTFTMLHELQVKIADIPIDEMSETAQRAVDLATKNEARIQANEDRFQKLEASAETLEAERGKATQ